MIPAPTVARYALDADELPSITQTLPLAEKARRTLMGIYKRLKVSDILGIEFKSSKEFPDHAPRVRSDVLSGKSDDGTSAVGHQHAYFLPTDEDGDGLIDHLTVYAEMGFGVEDPVELQALDRFRRLWLGGGEPFRLMLVGLDTADNFRSCLFRAACEWVSATPFIATRHPKKRGRKRDAPELLADPQRFTMQVLNDEIERLIQRRERSPEILSGVSSPDGNPELRCSPDGNPELRWCIEPLSDENDNYWIWPEMWSPHAGGDALRPVEFNRFRSKPGDDGGRRPHGAFRILFEREVRGPINLGFHSHFGMGLFLPAVK